ncbi:MAG: DUF3726 domain-containing protein [Ostreibacterium sp.]
MKISYNEIEVLCKKAFSGAGYSVGDYEDASLMIAWTELHGLDGLGELEKALPHLTQLHDKVFKVHYQDEIFTIIDANNYSVLTCGPVIIDAVAAKNTRRGTAALRLLNCYNRKLLLGYLSKYALQGHYISATWQASPIIGYIANYTAGKALPIIRRYNTDEMHMNFPKACSINVLFSQQLAFNFVDIDTNYALLALETQPDNLQLFEQNTYCNGIEVDESLWQALKNLAANNLVLSNEQSRQGAG